MIIPDKKKTVSVILSRLNPSGDSSGGLEIKNESESDPKMGDLKAICEDILQAFEDKSASALARAMRAFYMAIDED